jgi:predicted RNase H-like HicB family nuclease
LELVLDISNMANFRIQLFETAEGWSVSCSDLIGCHSQGETREEALENIKQAIKLWLEVEAEESGIQHVETLEVAV